ncbi:YggT family protein [Sphingomonas sp. HITSZ_GF]|uniref:YggT family protein n=1 Tax=Sphingomonas sp. HITSZ_GF TaxID=3037247 RepID=UPI00240CFB56|nr:YggT family protein [Sphingomonas sp. HITSZ_GF]MDG2534555.1 YggT family protein [Sphingomonas sp. HITSZ_GF]
MIVDILGFLLSALSVVIVIQAILSWLIAFNVINLYNEFVRSVWQALDVITRPIYRPIRKILPDFGALDLSPLVALLIIYVLNNFVLPTIAAQLAASTY